MSSTENWWVGGIDWDTPAGQLLRRFAEGVPPGRNWNITIFGSAPLQLTVDRQLLSGNVDLFSDDDTDLATLISAAGLGRESGGLHLEPGYELSFRTSPRWRQWARVISLGRVTFTVPHPMDILLGKLSRLDPKDLLAFRRVRELTGHPTEDELRSELQHAVDLFRPAFDHDSPNRLPDNVRELWRQLFGRDIDVRGEIIEPALERRRKGFGEEPPDYKAALLD